MANHELLSNLIANKLGVILPFFTVECKSQLPTPGSLWVAENQAAGSSATCVKLMEHLNEHVKQHAGDIAINNLDTSVFSVVTNGNEARLSVTWKSVDGAYLMKEVRGYLLSQENQYIQFRRAVRNILDWGMNERLEGIRLRLRTLRHEQETGGKRRRVSDASPDSEQTQVKRTRRE